MKIEKKKKKKKKKKNGILSFHVKLGGDQRACISLIIQCFK
mgnify:CR=1 FL=1